MEVISTVILACMALAVLLAACATLVFLIAAMRFLRDGTGHLESCTGRQRLGPDNPANTQPHDELGNAASPEAQMSGAMQAGFENLMCYTVEDSRRKDG